MFSNVFLEGENSQYLIGLEEHVDDPRGTVAPVDQQIPRVTHTGRVIAGRELQLADVVYTRLDQAV